MKPSALHRSGRILLLNHSRLLSVLVAQPLREAGHEVLIRSDLKSGLAELLNGQIDVLCTPLELGPLSGLDLLAWLTEQRPEIKVIICATEASVPLLQYLQEYHAHFISIHQKEIEKFTELIQYILENKSISEMDMKFTAKSLSIHELLQLLVSSKKTTGLYLSDEITKHEGLICFEAGKIMHAEYEDLMGIAAMKRIIQIQHGHFKEIPLPAYPESLCCSFNSILSEAAYHGNEPKALFNQEEEIQLLVVDQDSTLLQIIQRHFSYSGFHIDVAHAAEEAIEKLQKQDYHLVATDLYLPRQNGMDLVLWLQKRGSTSKVVMMTEELSEDLRFFLQDNGVIRFFRKPLDIGKFQAFIRYMFYKNQFSGELSRLHLLDILMVLGQKKSPRLLQVLGLYTNLFGSIYLEQGHVVHASIGPQEGLEALNTILKIQQGLVIQATYKQPTTHSCHFPVSKIYLDHQQNRLHLSPSPSVDWVETNLSNPNPQKIVQMLTELELNP